MAIAIKDLIERLQFWPEEDLEELDGYARLIEARRTGVYHMSDDDRAAVMRGLEEANRGEFVSDEEFDEFWKRYRVK